MLTQQQIADFQKTVTDYYRQHGRHDIPWRIPEADGDFDPYKILASEIMLQQTQVSRVIPKFQSFISQFPTQQTLAKADQAEVLRAWSGLGYNRRARFLQQAVQAIHTDFADTFPIDLTTLIKLPGIGHNTAAAILAYAYDQPVVFIETNIRTVFIHHFFKDQQGIDDRVILELVSACLPKDDTREWYWALMDYGSYLKATVGNPNQASKHYAKQSRFEGSQRQIRGRVIHLLGIGPQSASQLQTKLADDRLTEVLQQLVQEGLIQHYDQQYSL